MTPQELQQHDADIIFDILSIIDQIEDIIGFDTPAGKAQLWDYIYTKYPATKPEGR